MANILDINNFKHPVLLSIFAGVVVYSYLYWQQQQKIKKNSKYKKVPVSILTPGVVAIIVWFIATSYKPDTNNSNSPDIQKITENQIKTNLNIDNMLNNPAGISQPQILQLQQPQLTTLTTNHIKLPPPDVFIDLAKF